MADYHFGGSEEENAELRKLEAELVSIVTRLVPCAKHFIMNIYIY